MPHATRAKNRSDKSFTRSQIRLFPIIAHAAAAYYWRAGRSFPWRDERDPFRLAVAEILLQKTRASSVISTYRDLIAQFDGPNALADAGAPALQELLLPLGLSAKRASQLVAMAEAVAKSGNCLFDDWRVLMADVPGLGAYGARAIASFCHAEKIGIVDANIARIFRRMFCVETMDPRAVIYQKLADAVAAESDDIRASNFGLLDIGATICLPRPECDRCPFLKRCPRYRVPK